MLGCTSFCHMDHWFVQSSTLVWRDAWWRANEGGLHCSRLDQDDKNASMDAVFPPL